MDRKPVLVTRASLPPMEEYTAMLKHIWDTAWLTNMGEYHQRLEAELLDYLEVENISLFTNGHQALELLIQACDLKGEVITTPFSFVSTTHAIVRNGLKPVFCDINPEDFTIDTSKLEALINERTSAILPVHVYGNICNYREIERIAKKHGLKVIYDAAHTFGESIDGQSVGSLGDASMFSFHATKVFNTIEGGAVCSASGELIKKLNYLKNFGIEDKETVNLVGSNAKMNEFQAAMGLCNLNHISEMIERRKELVRLYESMLGDIKGIRLNIYKPEIKYNYAYMPAVFDKEVFGRSRDDVYEALAEKGIFARKYFYPCINELDCYRNDYFDGSTPVAAKISRQVLTLPVYPDLEPETVREICDIIIGRRL